MTQVYNKLVRDRIPAIITESGKSCTTRILEDGEYLGYALVMMGDYFIPSVYQELYLKCYDVICDDYYFRTLSEQVLTEEELYDMNLFDCRIKRNCF